MTLSDYLRLPWTIVRSEHQDDGEYIALHVRELPGFVVAAASEDELELMFWPALAAFISSYLEDGEAPPIPERLRQPSRQGSVEERAPGSARGERIGPPGPCTRTSVSAHRYPVPA